MHGDREGPDAAGVALTKWLRPGAEHQPRIELTPAVPTAADIKCFS